LKEPLNPQTLLDDEVHLQLLKLTGEEAFVK